MGFLTLGRQSIPAQEGGVLNGCRLYTGRASVGREDGAP